MPSYNVEGVDTLVNTETADGQISPRAVPLANGKYMVIWVGGVTLPVVSVGGTIAGSYANADIRAQIYNADGTRSGGEFIVNTTTAGGQLRPVVAQLSDGNVLITWHDGVGPSGGTAETVSNTIRGQEFNNAGLTVGSEFAIGSSNGRLHSIAATANGGFVATYQEGGIGGALAVGNVVARVFDSSNSMTSSFVVDSSQPIGNHNGTYSAVEADGDIVIYWTDRNPSNGSTFLNGARFDSSGNVLTGPNLSMIANFGGAVALATGGHAVIAANSGLTLYAIMYNADGITQKYVQVAQLEALNGLPTITATANGGFIASWIIDSDPTTGFNAEIMARAFNALGNPIGPAFQVNSIASGNQSALSLVQLTNGDLIAAWSDDSHLTGDNFGTGINSRRIDYNPANQNPVAADFSFSLYGVAPGTAITENPANIAGFFGASGYDADGDPLIISAIGNVANGSVILNPNGTLTMTTSPGATGRLAFDYTVSDGVGGFATARATVTLPSDFATTRAGESVLIDFLANDFVSPDSNGSINLSQPSPFIGSVRLAGTTAAPQINYSTLGKHFGNSGEIEIQSALFDLLVGQSTVVQFSYNFYDSNFNYNNVVVMVTVEGWAQLGGAGDDSLIGSIRADHLSGGDGVNVLTGLAGDDWYSVTNTTTSIVEAAGEGNDSVRVALNTYVLPENVENLYPRFPLTGVTAGLINWSGNGLDNFISAAGISEGVTFNGLGGNDTIIGSIGNDILNGGDGDDYIYGERGADVLNGDDGNDTLISLANSATFNGGNGNDLLVAGNGANAFFGGNDLDTVSYVNSFFSIGVNFTTGIFTGAAQGDTFHAIEAIIGSIYSDALVGDASNNVFDGGDGDDTLETGAGGQDSLIGGAGNDRFIVSAGASGSMIDGGSGFDTLEVNGAYTLAEIREAAVDVHARNDDYARLFDGWNVRAFEPLVAEAIRITAASPIGTFAPGATITGLEAIQLNNGAVLTLTATQYKAGFVNPVLSGSGALVFNLELADPVLSLTGLTRAVGSTATITISGSTGNDQIKGVLGTANTINGGDGVDQIRGGNQADTISGGNGNDKLYGAGGADILTGGVGSDQFRYVFATDSGLGAAADQITDFAIAEDRLNFALIDADANTAGDQAFGFIGTAAFTNTGTGQIRYQDSGANLLVQVDTDGNGTVDMEVVLQGLAGQALSGSNFLL